MIGREKINMCTPFLRVLLRSIDACSVTKSGPAQHGRDVLMFSRIGAETGAICPDVQRSSGTR